MGQRSGTSGTVETVRDLVVVVPAIVANVNSDVALAADAAWKGETALRVTPVGAPLAGLQILQAWISNAATGVVTIRFSAAVGGCAGGNQSVRLEAVPRNVV